MDLLYKEANRNQKSCLLWEKWLEIYKVYSSPKYFVKEARENSIDKDQMQQNAPSDQGWLCFPIQPIVPVF